MMTESTILHISVEIVHCSTHQKASQIILEYLTKASKSSLDSVAAHLSDGNGDSGGGNYSTSVSKSTSRSTSWCCEDISLPFLFSCGAVYKKGSADLLPMRAFCDFDIQPGDYIRVHYTPRLYPIAQRHASFWLERVVFECDNFLIINKPAGIPSNPTVDNFYENILQVYSTVYARKGEEKDTVDSEPPLFLPQRLDTDTSGLLLMARTKIFAGYFGQLLKDRATKSLAKRYRALVASEDSEGGFLLSPGTLKGHLSRQQITPRVFVRALPENPLCEDKKTDTAAEWQYCETRIVGYSSRIAKSVAEWMEWIDGQRGDDPDDKAHESHLLQLRAAFCEWFARHEGSRHGVRIALQEVELELVTGRTHQIRGQLQALQRDSSSAASAVLRAEAEAEADDFLAAVLLAGGHIAGDNLYTGCTSNSSEPVKISPFLALQSYRLEFADPIAVLQPAAEGSREDKKFAQVRRRVRQAMRSVPQQVLQKSYRLREVWWMPLHKLLYPLTRL